MALALKKSHKKVEILKSKVTDVNFDMTMTDLGKTYQNAL